MILGATLVAGCVEYIPIKPTELAKLNESFTAPAVGSGGQVLAVRVAQVESPSGRIVEIKGEYGVRITLKDLTVIEVDHPVRARFTPNGSRLAIAGGNRAESVVRVDEIATVEVSQPDGASSAIAGVFLGLAAAGATALLVIVIV